MKTVVELKYANLPDDVKLLLDRLHGMKGRASLFSHRVGVITEERNKSLQDKQLLFKIKKRIMSKICSRGVLVLQETKFIPLSVWAQRLHDGNDASRGERGRAVKGCA